MPRFFIILIVLPLSLKSKNGEYDDDHGENGERSEGEFWEGCTTAGGVLLGEARIDEAQE